mmetsp:Transcript_8045/g.35582  ORF Transcript_8045/g.35582 Transcript_8045/m.35582 type:complete len:242 (-) Transcript_8045:1530-2255(-)
MTAATAAVKRSKKQLRLPNRIRWKTGWTPPRGRRGRRSRPHTPRRPSRPSAPSFERRSRVYRGSASAAPLTSRENTGGPIAPPSRLPCTDRPRSSTPRDFSCRGPSPGPSPRTPRTSRTGSERLSSALYSPGNRRWIRESSLRRWRCAPGRMDRSRSTRRSRRAIGGWRCAGARNARGRPPRRSANGNRAPPRQARRAEEGRRRRASNANSPALGWTRRCASRWWIPPRSSGAARCARCDR